MNEFLNSSAVKKQLETRGVSADLILEQISQFERGKISVELIRPATINDGIVRIGEKEENEYIEIYNSSLENLDVIKFVPASGAASRMFKGLVSEYTEYAGNESPDLKSYEASRKLVENLPRFAFYSDLKAVCDSEEFKDITEKLLFKNGLNYSNLPKGLIKFHRYGDSSRTAFEEHLVEAKGYIKNGHHRCKLHFTVPGDALTSIKTYLDSVKENYCSDGTSFDIGYSVQNPSTDTAAVDLNNKPVLSSEGELVFRPAGHGALIQNLNAINSEMIFIKNIDNVSVENYLEDTVKFKKLLGGYLIFIKDKIHSFLKLIDGGNADEKEIGVMEEFLTKHLFLNIEDISELNEKPKALKKLLNRPIRVSGVVQNVGEPGGGPFWVDCGESGESLQIVESAQVNTDSERQLEIWKSSTHFNPVDIVCWVTDYRGNKFDLKNYIDRDAGIITKKSIEGREIKALELPGLWNGAMANWLTVFVEVPTITFNPVKTVFDLLKKEHTE